MRRGALVVLLCLGCSVPSPEAVELIAPDAAYYEANVQVVVGYGCGSLDCHGDPGRPLRLYARDGLRLRADLRGRELTLEEAAANAESFAGVDPGAAPPSHVALTKPLAEEAGGLPHVGGDIWASHDDPAYRCVSDWLRGVESVDVCAEASAARDPR